MPFSLSQLFRKFRSTSKSETPSSKMTSTQSKACCTVSPIVEEGYEGKGSYDNIAGTKTYVTGSAGAKTGLLIIYDIFGFFPQTIQGADILAHGDKERPYRVFMPDFFDGEPLPVSVYPPDTEEKQKTLGEFFSTKAAPPNTLARIPKLLKELEAKFGIEQWGCIGFCWGGKIVNISSGKDTPWKAAAAAHPAMVDPEDAKAITIPFAMLPSGDESKEDVEKWQEAIKVKHVVQWYPNQCHGFMAARGDLKDPAVKSDYEKAYKLLLDFFHEHLSA